MIYDFISSYRPSYLPKTWVFSAQSAEPLRHRHAHDQEILSGKKKRHFQTKRTACCFVLTHLLIHLLHLCMKKLSADHDPSYWFICLYIHIFFNLFITFLFMHLSIYLLYSFIHLFMSMCSCTLACLSVGSCEKSPQNGSVGGIPDFQTHTQFDGRAAKAFHFQDLPLQYLRRWHAKKHPLESKNARYDDLIL